MLRRKSLSCRLPGNFLREANITIRCFQNGLVCPKRNTQHKDGAWPPQQTSARRPGAQQPATVAQQQDPGKQFLLLREWPFLGRNVRRPTSPHEEIHEWQDFPSLDRSNFRSQFCRLSMPHVSAQFGTDFPQGKGRHYGVPAYQDSDEQSEFEASDVEELTNCQFQSKAVPRNSGPAAVEGKHQKGEVVSRRGFPNLKEEQGWRRPPAEARDLSKLTIRKPTHSYVCEVLREQNDPELAWQFFLWAGQQEGYHHTARTYNSMLMTFCSAMRLNAVFSLLETMRQGGFALKSMACAMILKSLAVAKMFDDAIRLFETAEFYGCKPTLWAYNWYLYVLVKAGHCDHRLDAALKEMQTAGLAPDLFTYTILMGGFRKAKNVDRACRVYKEMKAKGIEPNATVYARLLRTLVSGGKTDEALQLYSEITENGAVPNQSVPYSFLKSFHDREGRILCSGSDSLEQTRREDDASNLTHYHSLIPLLCKERNFAPALRMLREMESRGCAPPISMYNLVLSSLAKADQMGTMMKLFSHLRDDLCVTDKESYSKVVVGHCKVGNVEDAMRLHEEMVTQQGFASSTWLCNLVMHLLVRSDEVDRLFEFFSRMRPCMPDAYTYNILMSALCHSKDPQKVLKGMKRAGITSEFLRTRTEGGLSLLQWVNEVARPQVTVYDTFLHALCNERRVDDAVNLLLDMRKQGLVPGPKGYGRVLDLLGNAGQTIRAWKLFLQLKNGSPDMILYSIMIKILAKAQSFGKAHKLLLEMKKSRCLAPSPFTYTPLLVSLGKAGRLREMYKLFLEMEADGVEPETITYACVLSAFAREGQVDRAYRLFEESIDRGCVPNAFCYNPLLRGYFETNRTDEALDLYAVMKSMGCVEDETTRRIVRAGLRGAGLLDMGSELSEGKRSAKLEDSRGPRIFQ